ncbi:exosomal polycystin-1-interacting protein-like [Halichoeres trimaculatus]|uniref:exosomal polycystin-1-interacting protein-like n=1 Tax=Halichoeres trimaculatus TaxID=147232 RepID=UPI003D9E2855
MEMSPHTPSSAWLLWLLWWLSFLTPPSEASPPLNSTLLFDSGAPSFSLRNCSCSTPIRDCSEALANSVCRCHTVLRSALPPAGLREEGLLTVWVKEEWVLQEVLNRSTVAHLRLSFCGERPTHSQYLSLLGLQTLRVHSPHAPYPTQDISITPPADFEAPSSSTSSSSIHVTFLDLSVLNGLSALKAYSVLGPPPHTFSQHFPHLHLPPAPSLSGTPEAPVDHQDWTAESLLLTFIY